MAFNKNFFRAFGQLILLSFKVYKFPVAVGSDINGKVISAANSGRKIFFGQVLIS